jgi:hypothetical protein
MRIASCVHSEAPAAAFAFFAFAADDVVPAAVAAIAWLGILHALIGGLRDLYIRRIQMFIFAGMQ